MGDCRIRLQIASSLLSSSSSSLLLLSNKNTNSNSNSNPTTTTTTIVRVVAADSTIHELLQGTLLPWDGKSEDRTYNNSTTLQTVLDLVDQCGASVWDCTLHPGINITAQCRAHRTTTTTLYAAGWFPSGTLQILPAHATQPQTAAAEAYYDNNNNKKNDGPYCQNNHNHNNRSNEQAEATTCVSKLEQRPLPSHVLHAVTQRHAENSDDDHARRLLRQQNRQHQHQKQQARDHKLEARLEQLRQNTSKSTTVSKQVQRMLVQSRATPAGSARPDLPMADRVYLHCLLWLEQNHSSTTSMDLEQASDWVQDYRYFSHQDTVGRVLASFSDRRPSSSKPKEGVQMELLVAQSIIVFPTANQDPNGTVSPTATTATIPETTTRYRRLPVTMRLYEAISQSYLSGKVDTVVIRWYDHSQDEGTLSILAKDDNNNVDEDDEKQHPIDIDIDETDTTKEAREESKLPAEHVVDDLIPIMPPGPADGHSTKDEAAPPPPSPEAVSSSDNKYQHLLSAALVAFDQDTTTKKKKSSTSAAAGKVRQMQMKSQARGDTKRVKNLTDRFVFELVLARKANDEEAPPLLRLQSLGPMFLARTDRIDRLLRDCLVAVVPAASVPQSNDTRSWELWRTVPGSSGSSSTASDTTTLTQDSLQRIATSLESHVSWQDMEQLGKVQNFDRLLLLLL